MKKQIFFFLCFFVLLSLCVKPAVTQTKIEGTWEGVVEVMGQKLDMRVHFEKEEGELKAYIDFPQQGIKRMALQEILYEHPKISFVLKTPAAVAYFEGIIEGENITGEFKQSGIKGKFHLAPGKEEEEPEPSEPLPYNEEEVTFENGDIKLTGTLTLPKKSGRHPAVIMITGSGPQNRDEELFGWKIFRDIADHLTRNDIAVLRYDDRGVGGSTGNVFDATSEDFAADVLSAVKFLRARSDINPSRVGLCGHSEGGIVAPLSASQSKDVAFIICLSGTGIIGKEVLLTQMELIARADGTPEQETKKYIEDVRTALEMIKKEPDEDKVKSVFMDIVSKQLETMTEEQKKDIEDVDAYLKNQVEGMYKQFSSPWFEFFLEYDPAPTLEKVACSVLLLFGELDLQVPAEMNNKAMVKALRKGGNKDFTAKIFPKANHLFQSAKTGSPSKYAKLPKEFVPGFLDYITDWIKKRVDIVM
ncbi:MAG: alpha/beta fold hydrolase [Candidatus Aminicenantes bacterium]|nr:MAG: alpha/beta fold hydrolase [Candidatus Aminicenantes bacterium]